MPFHIYMLRKYNDILNEIKALNIPTKTKVLYYLISIGVSLLIFSGALCVLINLMIFRDMQKLLAFGIATIICLICFTIDLIYYKAITQGNVKGIRVVILTNTFVFALAIYTILIILFILGVV